MADSELDYAVTSGPNTDIGGVSVAEGIPPSNLNDAVRSMAALRALAITRHVEKAGSSYIAVKEDHNQFWRFTGPGTINFTAISALADGWCLWVRADGGDVTLNPSGSELIDGSATSAVLSTGSSALVICTGTAFYTMMSGAGSVAENIVHTAATVQATTSATTRTFTNIPSWVKKITVMLSAVSTNGTSPIIIQIGDSGGYEASGYLGERAHLVTGASVSTNASTAGFSVAAPPTAGVGQYGIANLTLLDPATNLWAYAATFGTNNAGVISVIGMSKALSATLDRLQLTTEGGVNTFDAGSMNIMYSS